MDLAVSRLELCFGGVPFRVQSLEPRARHQFAPRLFECVRRELDIIKHVEHEVIDRHRSPRCARFLLLLLAMCALKNRLYDGSGFGAWRFQHRNAVGVILYNASTRVAAYLGAGMAFVIYLKYKCHGDQITRRLPSQQRRRP
jgi:hypothetical protein